MKFVLAIVASCLFALPCAANPQVTQALNDIRQKQGLAPVTYAPRLEDAARAHALDMAKHGYFAHEGRNGSSVGDRVRAAGYRWCVVAENLAKGRRDLAQVMNGWAASPGHYQNMIHKKAAEVGLFQGPDRIWAMVLAAPC